MKQLKDYLHLYLGAECIVNMKRYLVGATGKNVNLESVRMRFDSINRNSDIDQCWGVTFEEEGGIQFFDCFDKLCRTYTNFVHSTELKLILRPLSDMTEEEKLEYFKLGFSTELFDKTYGACEFGKCEVDKHNLTGHSFSYNIEVIHNGKKNNWMGTATLYQFNTKQMLWLLSKGFDLFGLIEEGLAIKKGDELKQL